MQVARIHGAGDMRLREEPAPVPANDEVLVKVTAVGVCGSDVHWLREGGIGSDRVVEPMVLGHECAGVIESGPRKGERVAIDPACPCGICEFCRQGNPNICSSLRFAGHAPYDGVLREYIAWPEKCLFALPESMTDIEGVMLEPLGVAIFSVDCGFVNRGLSVGVFGCGAIGLCVIQVARAAGVTSIFATELPGMQRRIEAARKAGATVFEAGAGREVDAILNATGGRGVDVAFEAAGDPQAVEASISAVKPGGNVMLIGIPSDDRTAFSASTARHKDLTIRAVHRMKHTYPRAIRLVQNRQVDVQSMVTHRFPLSEVSRAYSTAETREGIKIIVEC